MGADVDVGVGVGVCACARTTSSVLIRNLKLQKNWCQDMDPKINQGFCLAWLSWIAKRRHIIRLCNIGFQSFFKVRRATIQRLRSAYQKTENAVSEITVYPFWHFQLTPFQTQPSPAPASGIKQNLFRNTI